MMHAADSRPRRHLFATTLTEMAPRNLVNRCRRESSRRRSLARPTTWTGRALREPALSSEP